MCVRLPDWPIQRLAREPSEPDGRELLLYEQAGRASARITACSAGARRRGVRPGMPLGEAISLATEPTGRSAQADGARSSAPPRIELHDPSADRAALEELADWTHQRFSPTVGLLEAAGNSAGLWLDVTGCERLFEGESSLARQVVIGYQRRGLQACVALADTLGAAWALAQSIVPGEFRTVTPFFAASPERGRTCASKPCGSAMASPVGTIARSPGASTSVSPSASAAVRSMPAAPSVS